MRAGGPRAPKAASRSNLHRPGPCAEDRELGYYLAHRESGVDPLAGLILNKPDDDGTSIRFDNLSQQDLQNNINSIFRLS